MKTIIIILAGICLYSCGEDPITVKSGEMHFIPFTDNWVIGTDSTIVIVDRYNGQILNTIKR